MLKWIIHVLKEEEQKMIKKLNEGIIDIKGAGSGEARKKIRLNDSHN